MTTPISVIVTIWSLRSVPISMLMLMFIFNSGSLRVPNPNLSFWFDAISVIGIIGIITYWNSIKKMHWNIGFTIYLYIFLVLFLRNPYGILAAIPEDKLALANWPSILNTLWVGAGIFGMGMLLEVLIFQLHQFKTWAWWIALSVSILYVASIVFFFSGTLGIWSLLDTDTKKAFKHRLRYFKN